MLRTIFTEVSAGSQSDVFSLFSINIIICFIALLSLVLQADISAKQSLACSAR